RVTIELDRSSPGGYLRVKVADDGVGMHESTPPGGLGRIGMRERVVALRGALDVVSSSGHGLRLSARLPVRAP
ncbi:MAG: sensor histidine kinase, partial [Steroidobacteraceae bacterium]